MAYSLLELIPSIFLFTKKQRRELKEPWCAGILFDPGHNDSHWDTSQRINLFDPKTGMVLHSDVPSLKCVLRFFLLAIGGLRQKALFVSESRKEIMLGSEETTPRNGWWLPMAFSLLELTPSIFLFTIKQGRELKER